MDEKEQRKRFLEIFDDACSHGLGEMTIKFLEDNGLFIVYESWKINPTESEVETAYKTRKSHGGVSIDNNGESDILKRKRKYSLLVKIPKLK